MKIFFRILFIILILVPIVTMVYVFRDKIFKFAEKPAVITQPSYLRILTSSKAYGFFVDTEATSTPNIYYLSDDGIHRMTVEGGNDVLVAPIKQYVQNISSTSGGMIVKTTDSNGTNPHSYIFTPRTETLIELPDTVVAATLNHDGSRVASLISESTGVSRIVISNADLSSPKTVLSFAQTGFNIAWPNQETIYLMQPPSNVAQSSVWKVDVASSTINNIIAPQTGMIASFSEASPYMMVFSRYALALESSIDGTTILSLPQTLPSKCAWGESAIYCGVPQGYPKGVILPDSYLQRAFYSVDSLYRIDLSTKQSGEVTLSNLPALDINSPILLENQELLIFINRYDQKLYSMSLKGTMPTPTASATPTSTVVVPTSTTTTTFPIFNTTMTTTTATPMATSTATTTKNAATSSVPKQ